MNGWIERGGDLSPSGMIFGLLIFLVIMVVALVKLIRSPDPYDPESVIRMKPLNWWFPFQWFGLMCLVVFLPLPTLVIWLILWFVKYCAREFAKANQTQQMP